MLETQYYSSVCISKEFYLIRLIATMYLQQHSGRRYVDRVLTLVRTIYSLAMNINAVAWQENSLVVTVRFYNWRSSSSLAYKLYLTNQTWIRRTLYSVLGSALRSSFNSMFLSIHSHRQAFHLIGTSFVPRVFNSRQVSINMKLFQFLVVRLSPISQHCLDLA
jgi:hypothetical protein